MKNAQKTLAKQLAAKKEAEKAQNAVQEQPVNEPEEPKKETVVLNKQQIEAWKKQYGKVFRTVIGSDAFIWHRLSRQDYVSLMTDENVSDNEDERLYERQVMACKAAILWPENVDKILEDAGCIASNFGGVIMENSGFRLPVTDEM